MYRSVSRLVAAASVAVAAVAGGHAAVYSLVPGRHVHTHALDHAGHSHWPVSWLVVALLAVLGTSCYGFLRERHHGTPAWTCSVPRLGAGQVGGFLLLEAGERVAGGIPVGELLAEPVIAVGVLVQVVAAGLVSILLHASDRLARWLAAPPARRAHRLPTVAVPADVVVPLGSRPDQVGLTRRGPPVCC